MARNGIVWIICLFLCINAVKAQKSQPWEFGGYLTGMQSQIFENVDERWYSDNLIHNRLNLFWYPYKQLEISLQARNRLLYGNLQQFVPNYAKRATQDQGLFDLSHNFANEYSYVLNSTLDRAFINYTAGQFEVTAGRQRINWGQNFVWNPNDVFNAYSFFEVDYPERPGSDAIRLQYYTGFASAVEIAAKLDHDERLTASALWRFNQWEYDFQLLGGIYQDDEAFIGAGWSGAIKNAGFRGETSYFQPRNNWQDTSGTFVIATGIDYMFSNSLYVQAEALYNEMPDNNQLSSFMSSMEQEFSAKRLLFTEYAFLMQASYPINPLWKVTLATMFFPDIEGYFLGPSIDYSASNNLDLSLIFQRFSGQFAGNLTSKQNLVYFRVKWNY